MDTMTATGLAAKLADASHFTLGELAKIARTFDVDPGELYAELGDLS